jgi:plasmid stabilization system protein ParE
MTRFVLHPEARADLDEIWEFIAADNLDAADRVLDEISRPFVRLGRFRAKATRAPISPLNRCAFTPSAIM